jgi:putative sugar O-methyltransferase
MNREILQAELESARQSTSYQHYKIALMHILQMMEEDPNASAYWQEELAGMDYMLDASPLVIRKLREHCYHITGLQSYQYRQHHQHQQAQFASKLGLLRQHDPHGLFVAEHAALGGFGFTVDGHKVNIDTLKFYEILLAMDKVGVLAPFLTADGQHRRVLEIGAGWGGFAYQFKQHAHNTTYLIIDLPLTLLFSMVYLQTVYPQARVLIAHQAADLVDIDQYDFVFMPHTIWDSIESLPLDLAINMISFQEMTSSQVTGYARKLHTLGCKQLFSHNRDRSGHNVQLSTVTENLAPYYALQDCTLLDIEYVTLAKGTKKRPNLRHQLKTTLKGWLRPSEPSTKPISQYRSLLGTRKGGLDQP